MLRLQLLAMSVAVAAMGVVHFWLGAIIPPDRLLWYDLIDGGFVLWWALSIAWLRLTGKITDDTADGWYGHTLAVFWLGNATTVITFWIAMPYASPALQLLVTMMCHGPLTVEIIGTVRTPSYGVRGRLGTLAPIGVPAGLGVWFAQSGTEFAIPVILWLTAFTATLLGLREVLQASVDAAWRGKRDADAARDARGQFLASASHDLGQPLQAARLFFDQVLQHPAGAARERAARNVHWAFETTEHLLGQMLDHLRLESGEVEARLEPLPLGPLIARVAEMHEPAARLKGLDIDALPTRLNALADRTLVERALGNLVVNAIRHAGARKVLVGARRQGERVRLWVIDDGVGIPEADRARLFEDHVRGSNHGDEIRGGFGLGLASCRRIAQLMGGAAGHEPRWTNGAAFWIDLPLG